MVRRLRIQLLLFVGMVALSSGALAESPKFTFEDMLGIRALAGGQPIAASPAGDWLAYVVTDLADEWNVLEPRPTGHLNVTRLSGGSPRSLTSGTTHGSYPAWSPDGGALAFFREDTSGGELVLWKPGSPELRSISSRFPGRSYLAPLWDPSGKRVVFAAAERPLEPTAKGPVKVVESTDARIPGDDFFVDKRRARLLVVDVESGRVTPLLSEPALLREVRLAPDGRAAIYSIPDPATYGVIGKETSDAYRVALEGGTPEKLSREDGRPDERIWSPDRKYYVRLVADRTIQDPEIEEPIRDMYSVARPFFDLYLGQATGGEERNLTSDYADQVSDPVWSPDGGDVFFKTTNNETYDEALRRYSLGTGRTVALVEGMESYDDVEAVRGALVFSAESATKSPDVYALDLASGKRTQATNLNPELARFRFSSGEMFSFWNADGEPLKALLYRPVSGAGGADVPVITWIYEKLTPGIHRFNARNQVFLNEGYALLLPNVKVKVGQTATSFVKSVVPAVNRLREMGFEKSRFGLWGHSFGAYATSYLITQTDIFSCAVSGATPPELFRNWASGRDRDSRNIESGQARMGGSPFEVPERYLSQSAFFQLDKVKTPVLILHGEKDLTILFGEGEMMFYALRQLGKEATFVAYAEGDHSLSRHSRADTLDVNHRILSWFEKHLKGEEKKETMP